MSESISKKITLLNHTILESFNVAEKETIIQKFMDTGLAILEADFGFAWWVKPFGQGFELVYKSPTVPYDPNFPRERGGNYLVQKKQEPLFVEVVKKEDYEEGYDVSPYMKSYVIIPICYKNSIYGNLVICYKDAHNFSEEEQGLSIALGNAAAQAITINQLRMGEQEARLESENQKLRFRSMIENSYDVIALLDANGSITDISGSITRMAGHAVGDLLGRNLVDFMHSDDVEKIQNHMLQTAVQPNKAMTVEARYRHSNGSWRWLEASAVNKLDDPSVNGIIANIRDITERKEAERTITHQALHDSLTGLPNRKEFHIRFDQALEQAKRNNRQIAIMFLDMDRFKNVNDRLGHVAGDSLLKVIASRLVTSIRGEDVACRFGGDEFLILINDIRSSKDVVVAAEKILRAVSLPVKVEEHTIHPTVSIGIAIYPNDGLDLSGLKRNADVALYRAKENGRNRLSLYDSSLHGLHQAERFTLENEFREALFLNQITVHYQPIISLKRNKIIALEALARWQHPEKGLLLPSEFISLAEETGLIAQLDKIVLRQACIQAKVWQDMGLPKFRIAVNVSAQQFSEPEFVAEVANTLAETGLEANCLEMEITESLAMGDLELTRVNLKALKNLGVQITIDDFGTGYSSLNYLKRFPIHGLKIDKSFVRHCITSAPDTSITKTIIAMAQTLNLQVTAEGVEEGQQMVFLQSLGCDAAQGFLIAKPMSAEDFPEWMEIKYPKKEEVPFPQSSTLEVVKLL